MCEKIHDYVHMHGLRYTFSHGIQKAMESYLGTFQRKWAYLSPSQKELRWQQAHPPLAGTISVVIPVYKPRLSHLEALVNSLRNQSYGDFEVILFEAGGLPEIRRYLHTVQDTDSRFRIILSPDNYGISGNTNRAVEQVCTNWMVLMDHDDLLPPDALYRLAQEMVKGDADVIYTDEDKVTENGRTHTDAHWKPDLSPDTLRSSNYVCHLLAMRTAMYFTVGGEDPQFDGSQDHDLTLRLMEKTSRIRHIPGIGYHWRTLRSSASHVNLSACLEASARAAQQHTQRMGFPARVTVEGAALRFDYDIRDNLQVEAIVMEEKAGDGAPCVRSLRKSDYPRLHVRTVTAPASQRLESMNRAAEQSRADVLLFLDAGIQQVDHSTVREMLMYAQRPDVGAVTVPILDRRGRVLHAGFALGMDGMAQCLSKGILQKAGGFHQLLLQTHNVSAVSLSCFMVRKDHFLPFRSICSGPMEMVDWCLCMRDKGYLMVYTPHGAVTGRKTPYLLLGRKREAADLKALRDAWGQIEDPYWNPYMRRKAANYQTVTRREYRRMKTSNDL